ncbi:MAG TPA: inorganic phosphate transporter [Microbacteriaceae bacterium]|nr:inorganic phosphate transporter [Microbacteriaceae bacterium]
MEPWIVFLVIGIALVFDFTNGFHDTANAMATPIATGALKPRTAVALAAVLNLIGAFLSTAVALTISHGIINEDPSGGGIAITPAFVFAGVMAAVVWNVATWLFGLPSSSSHALFGGLIGAAIVGAGFGAIGWGTLVDKVIIPAIAAPLVAGLTAYLATRLVYAVTRRKDGNPDGRGRFKVAQIFSSSLVALAHGTNDAQKTMGVITLTLISAGMLDKSAGVPFWVIVACAVAIALGTYTGGWRIIRTIGTGFTDVKPAQGFAAETSTAVTILASSHLGFALSTTQVASGSVIGSGLGRRGSKVRWGTAGRVAAGWVLTLPASAIAGALFALLSLLGGIGVAIGAVIGAIVLTAMFLVSRRSAVGAHNVMSDVEEASQAVAIRPTRRRKGRSRR